MFAFEDAGPETKAGAWLLTGDLSRVVRLEHDASLLDARFSPDGARLATLSQDGTARIWSRDGVLEATLHHVGYVVAAAWSSDGSWLATGTSAGTLTIWDRSTWQPRKVIEAHVNYIAALAIDDRDSLIASGGGDGTVKLWDAKLLLQVARIPTGRSVQHLALERDRLLVSGPVATQAWRCDLY
jgi:WD40 repeat protein